MVRIHVFNNSEEMHHSMVDEVDAIFERVFLLCEQDTMRLKNTAEAQTCFARFKGDMKHSLRSLTQMKVYKPVDSSDFGSHNGRQLLHLVNQGRVISTLWAILRSKIHDLANKATSCYLDKAGNSDSKFSNLVTSWEEMHTNYKAFMILVLPLLEYVHINFPIIVKEIPKGLTVVDYTEILLVQTLKEKLHSGFIYFLEAFLDMYRAQDDLTNCNLNSEMPLTLMYKYKIAVDEDSCLPAEDFYLDNVTRYVENKVHIPVDAYYFDNLIDHLERNARITGMVSAILLERANDIFMRNTVLKKDVTIQLIEFLKACIASAVILVDPCVIPREKFQHILIAYTSRSMNIEFEEIYREIIRNNLKSGSNKRRDHEKPFAEACKLIIIAKDDKRVKSITKEEIVKVLGGSMNVMERYLKLCEADIRESNREFMRRPTDMPDVHFRHSVALSIPSLLCLAPSFLNLYSRSLFRRAIIHGPSIIETLQDPRFLEFHLISLFKKNYGYTSEYHNLDNLKEEIIKSSNLSLEFEPEGWYKTNFMTPLVFEKKMIPILSNENHIENSILPKQLEESWDKFVHYYQGVDTKAAFKKLHPIYYLQHCEVDTPYKLRDGKNLTLDLTLYQTCVLSLFNDFEVLGFDEILTKLQLAKSTLQEVLTSFINVGLLTLQNNQYSLNDSFSPDKRRVKDGKLRIPLSRPAITQSKGSVVATSLHREGHSSQWKQELLKACVVRSVKGERDGLNYDTLFKKVEAQIQGISVGEFKDALNKSINDNFITQENDLYIY